MMQCPQFPAPRRLLAPLLLVVIGALAGCATTGDSAAAYNDPYESVNRKTHEFNRSLDKAILRPVGVTYADNVPHEFRTSINNFGRNLSTPVDVVNDLLQLRIGDAAVNTIRFVMNSTIGIGGIADAATLFGIPPRDTDFGETLHVWGLGEGAYVELPVFGPSTQRDAVGLVVDFFTNPLSYATTPGPELRRAGTGARVSTVFDQRGSNADLVDGVLYESADSYAAARSYYLQNRRFELGQEASPGATETDDSNEDSFGYDDFYDAQ